MWLQVDDKQFHLIRIRRRKMANRKKWLMFLIGALMLTFILASCVQPTSQPTVPADVIDVIDPVAEEEQDAGDQRALIIGSWAELPNLNAYYLSGPEAAVSMVVEGLLSVDPEGNYVPNLVSEVPTVENGRVSEDGTVITYQLKEGLMWSDGESVTSADIRFTWEAITNPNNSVVRTLGHENIVSVATPDELTAVVTLGEPYVAYLTLFPALLPEHVLGNLQSMDNAPYNRSPIGTGPYQVVESVAGSHIEYRANPYYREEGKPKIQSVFIKWLPSREAGLAQVVTGEIHILEDITEGELTGLQGRPEINIVTLPGLSSERLFFNLGDQGDPDVPHPILGDPAVREALDLAIDREILITGLLEGRSTPGSSDLPSGPFGDPSIQPASYDPDRARQLLEDAGWVDEDGDGIREKDGQRLSLRIATASGNQLRELTQQLLQEQFADIGVELSIDNKESGAFWGSHAERGLRFTGDFDILLYTTGPGVTGAFVDPQAHMFAYYHSSSIPSQANEFRGGNYMRYASAEVDAALEEAGSVPDVRLRQEAYSRAMQVIKEDKPLIFLYNRPNIHVFRNEVNGYVDNAWLSQIPTWNIQDWTLE
jgi:peptide/nickel transport system substrate-binding protein